MKSILVTDGHELPGLGAVRSLGRAGYRVTAAHPEGRPIPAASWSRFCAGRISCPDPWRDNGRFREWLLREGARYDLVLPVSEASLTAAADLPSVNAVVPPAVSLPFTLSKRAATAKALEIGLACPPTAFDRKAALALSRPVVVKTDNQLTRSGVYLKGKGWYVEEEKHLCALLDDLEQKGCSWIAQECLPGFGAGAFILRWDGRTQLTFAHRRLHEVPFWGGWSSLREGVAAPDLVQGAERLLAAIGFEGAGMVEYRYSGGRPYFLEINGRLWGSLALALHSGADFPRLLVECHLHGAPRDPVPVPRTGLRCRNLYPGEFGYLSSVLRGKGAVNGVARPGKVRALVEAVRLSRGTRGDFFWGDDPLPGLYQGISAIREVTRAVRGRLWRRLRDCAAGVRARRFRASAATRTPDLGAEGTVLFLCYGNICRSAMAEAYWNRRYAGPRAVSAGFHPDAERPTPDRIVRIARSLGVDLTRHRSRRLTADDVRAASAIFVMDRWNLVELLGRHPEVAPKTWLLGALVGTTEIPDPYSLGDDEALASLVSIQCALDALAEKRSVSGTTFSSV